ncbi:hypothetical protein Golob_004864, partial [Gossypium lobatum]|nr:hypothetical protein [Gossypium lobatum]
MNKDYPKVSSFLAIKKNNEPEVVKPIKKKTSKVNSMVLIPKKRDGREGLMFVDINIAGQRRTPLIDTGASDLFISKKDAPTMGVVCNVELQIGEWKGNEEFE